MARRSSCQPTLEDPRPATAPGETDPEESDPEEIEESSSLLKPEMGVKVLTEKDMQVDEEKSMPPKKREKILLALLFLSLIPLKFQWDKAPSRGGSKMIPDSAPVNNDSKMTSDTGNCLDMQELDRVVSSANQIFILMPAKAGGQSLNVFADRCTTAELNYGKGHFSTDNTLHLGQEELERYMTLHVHPPKVISSHVKDPKPMLRLIDSVEQSSLVIFMYRNEFSRLKSAIKYVASKRMCAPGSHYHTPFVSYYGNDVTSNAIEVKDGRCTIDEDFLLQVVKDQKAEIGMGNNLLNCGMYDSIERSDPNLIFAHFTESDALQKIVAKHHCPEARDIPVRINDQASSLLKDGTVTTTNVYSKNANATVDIAEWVESKGPMLSWILGLHDNEGPLCNPKTKEMESDLLTCPSHFIRSTSTWKV
jgi:hypothetical protein